MKRNVAILGPVPPPHGGVSVHVVRLRELVASLGHDVRALPYTGIVAGNPLIKLTRAPVMVARALIELLRRPADFLHVHYGGLAYFMGLAPLLLRRRARVAVTFHSVRVRDDLAAAAPPLRRAALALLQRCDVFVCVREEIAAALREMMPAAPPMIVMPAFLPPAAAELDPARLPAALAAEMAGHRDAGVVQVGCAAYYLGPGYGHEDVYGVELLLSALAGIEADLSRDYALHVSVSNRPTGPAADAAARVAEAAAKLRRVSVRLHYEVPLLPVMGFCSGFLRPSREDGDSVALREALCLGRPVLASDVVRRPAGARTVGLEDPGLPAALASFLEELPAVPPPAAGDYDPSPYRAFVRELLGERAPEDGR